VLQIFRKVKAGTKGFACALQNDYANFLIGVCLSQGLFQFLRHRRFNRIKFSGFSLPPA
jgi:hypothetical protein